MTIDHPLRRFLARVCSADTMARVVDPTLADMRWESGRPSWAGCLALAKALLVHSIVSTPAVLARTWSEDDRAIPKAAGLALSGAFIAALPLIALPFLGARPASRGAALIPLAVLLVPQAIALTLPAALLLAIPLAFRRQDPSTRLTRRTVALSMCCVLATFFVMAWAVPEANQSFRVMTYRAVSGRQDNIPRGVNETGFAALRDKIEVLKLTPGGGIAARPIEFDFHVRLVLVSISLPVGILALAIARSQRGRRRPWTMGLAAMGGYVFVFFPLLIGARMLMKSSSLPPVLLAWAPIALLAVAALRAYSSTPAAPESSTAS
jgi:lipopolysaccharide export LptBFGC system permease protein LptF